MPDNEAKVKLAVEGPASAVDEALKKGISASSAQPEDGGEESRDDGEKTPEAQTQAQSYSEEEVDRCHEFLADPKNMVTVWRVMPARWNGQKTDVRCGDRWLCPQKFDELVADIFTRFGGKRFKVLIHPNTPKGESKVLDAFEIENPNTGEPLIEGAPYSIQTQAPAGIQIPTGGVDPTVVEDDSPLAQTRKAIQEKILALRMKAELNEARRLLEESEGKKSSEEESELRRLREELEDLKRKREVKDVLEEKLKRLEDSLERLSKQKEESGITQVLANQMKASEERFLKLLEVMIATNSNRESRADVEERLLDKLDKYKRIFGSEDSRVKRLEELAFSILEEKMFGAKEESGGGGEESPTVYAIKQLAPILKDYVERQFPKNSPETAGLSEADRARMIAETSKRLAVQMVEDLKRKGWVVPPGGALKAVAPPQSEGARPFVQNQPPVEPTQVPQEKPKPAKPVQYPVPEAVQAMPHLLGGIEVDLPGVGKVYRPPSPQSENYDRSLAVNFVLDSIYSEIFQRIPWEKPNDSYVPGDILDGLDDEFLVSLEGVESGDDLNRLLEPYAAPERLKRVKEIAEKDETVRRWLRRIVTTVQAEIGRSHAGSA